MTSSAPRYAIAVCLLALLAGCKTVQVTERTLIRPLPADSAAHAAFLATVPAPYDFEERRVETDDGASLYTLILRRPQATHTVLYFGGNMFRVSRMGPDAVKYLGPLRVNLVLVDHRAYGQSTGEPGGIEQLERDALAVYDVVRSDPDLAATRIIVHGHSLGSFLAGYVAQERRLDGLVLESSATTGEEWIRYADRRPWFIRPFIHLEVEDRLRAAGNLSRMAGLDESLMVLVGSEDAVTPPPLSRKLYLSAGVPSEKKRLHVLRGAGHNDVPAHPYFLIAYREFLRLVARQ